LAPRRYLQMAITSRASTHGVDETRDVHAVEVHGDESDKVDPTTQKRHLYERMPSPVGTLTLVATDDGLAAILWETDRPRRVRLKLDAEESGHPVLVETERQLEEYFAGRRTQFTLKLDPSGTLFRRTVWNALLTIPFGETRTDPARVFVNVPAWPGHFDIEIDCVAAVASTNVQGG
jgi:hypothetical protein